MNSISKGNEGFYQEKDLPVRQAERARAATNDSSQAVLAVFCGTCNMQLLGCGEPECPKGRDILKTSMRYKARRSP
jgi:hypothetical protein